MKSFRHTLEREAREALDDFEKRYGSLFEGFNREDVEIEVLDAPHKPGPLPPGRQAVIVFYWPERDDYVYISYAGPNSNARYQSQHYTPKGSPSNLAKRILAQRNQLGLEHLDELSIGPWMRQHLARINFLFPAHWEREVLNVFKKYLKQRLHPLLGG